MSRQDIPSERINIRKPSPQNQEGGTVSAATAGWGNQKPVKEVFTMHRTAKGILAKALVLTLAATLAGTAPDADAAKAKKPKLSKNKVTVAVKKTAKIKIKNVKANQVKKLSVKTAKKATATVKKNGKTAFTITGKKAGKTTVTASVKVGRKTTKLKVAVTVKGGTQTDRTAAPATTAPAAPSASAPASQAPSAPAPTQPAPTETPFPRKELKDVKVEVDPAADPETMKESNPRIQAPETVYTQDFETDEPVCVTPEPDAGEGALSQYNIGGILSGRGDEKFEIVDGGVNGGKCLKITERWKYWHGMRINLEEVGDIINKGGTYKFSAKVKLGGKTKDSDEVRFCEEVKTTEDASEAYNDMDILKCPTDWTEITGTFSVPDSFYHYAVYLQTNESATQVPVPGDTTGKMWFPDIYVDDVKIECVDKVSPLENLTSLYETYKDTVPYVGTACSYSQILGKECVDFMKSQYNCVTPGNEMKPDAVLGAMPEFLTLEEAKADPDYYIPEGYETDPSNMKNGETVVPKLNFTNVDQFLKAAKEAGLKVRPHTLVWHEQTPVFFFQKEYKTQKNNPKNNYNVSAETMDGRLEFYIRTLMNHVLGGEYADTVYAWDVVNEYFHSHGASEKTKNTSYYENIYGAYKGKEGAVADGSQSGMTTEPSYVKLAFQIAHDELVKYGKAGKIKLFYNDFNTYDVQKDICHLVNYVNSGEKLMDGVGMQTHLSLEYPSVELYKTTLEFFRVNIPDVEIQITELDVTMNYGQQPGGSYGYVDLKQTDKQQGAYHYDLMKAILQEKKAGLNLTGLVFWSLYDGVSWRAAGTPCIFNGLNSPKSAYYAVLDAKEAVK